MINSMGEDCCELRFTEGAVLNTAGIIEWGMMSGGACRLHGKRFVLERFVGFADNATSLLWSESYRPSTLTVIIIYNDALLRTTLDDAAASVPSCTSIDNSAAAACSRAYSKRPWPRCRTRARASRHN